MDPNQNYEDRVKTEVSARLKRRRTSLMTSPIINLDNAPERIMELKTFGFFDTNNNLLKLQFINMNNGSQTNVIAESEICSGAMIYKGTHRDALGIVNKHKGSYYVLKPESSSICLGSPLPRGWRCAEMTFRFVGRVNENAKSLPELAIHNIKAGDPGLARDVVVILLPRGVPMLRIEYPPITACPFIHLVMEGMLVGRFFGEASEICQFYFD